MLCFENDFSAECLPPSNISVVNNASTSSIASQIGLLTGLTSLCVLQCREKQFQNSRGDTQEHSKPQRDWDDSITNTKSDTFAISVSRNRPFHRTTHRSGAATCPPTVWLEAFQNTSMS